MNNDTLGIILEDLYYEAAEFKPLVRGYQTNGIG